MAVSIDAMFDDRTPASTISRANCANSHVIKLQAALESGCGISSGELREALFRLRRPYLVLCARLSEHR